MKPLKKLTFATLAGLCLLQNTYALENGRTDANSPIANATVKIAGCTGTLIRSNLVLTSGHCLENRPKPAGHVDFPHACANWQNPTRWYQLGAPVPVSVGRDSRNWDFQTQARSYTLPGCLDIMMVRLDAPVPAQFATPATVVTRQAFLPGARATLQVVGWGSSGLEDLWVRDAQTTSAPWNVIGHAHQVNGMARSGAYLYAATEDNTLWRRLANMNNTPWQYVGQAPHIVAMAASSGKLYAATANNRLIVRAADAFNRVWRDIDGASNVVGMTALGGRLYAATSFNALWVRPANDGVSAWTLIGHANRIVGLAAANGKIFGATSDDVLWARDPALSDVPWVRVGAANDIRAMAATPDKIFAAQRAPDAGSPQNANRYRQTAGASFAARSCSTGTALEQRAEFCVDPAGKTRIRNGDSGGPVFELRNDGTRWLIGVARQDTGILSSSQGILANYVPTAFINSPDGLVGSGDVGPWLELMAGVGPGR